MVSSEDDPREVDYLLCNLCLLPFETYLHIRSLTIVQYRMESLMHLSILARLHIEASFSSTWKRHEIEMIYLQSISRSFVLDENWLALLTTFCPFEPYPQVRVQSCNSFKQTKTISDLLCAVCKPNIQCHASHMQLQLSPPASSQLSSSF